MMDFYICPFHAPSSRDNVSLVAPSDESFAPVLPPQMFWVQNRWTWLHIIALLASAFVYFLSAFVVTVYVTLCKKSYLFCPLIILCNGQTSLVTVYIYMFYLTHSLPYSSKQSSSAVLPKGAHHITITITPHAPHITITFSRVSQTMARR